MRFDLGYKIVVRNFFGSSNTGRAIAISNDSPNLIVVAASQHSRKQCSKVDIGGGQVGMLRSKHDLSLAREAL